MPEQSGRHRHRHRQRAGPSRVAAGNDERNRPRKTGRTRTKRKSRRLRWGVLTAVLVGLLVVGVYVGRNVLSPVYDYSGNGKDDVVVEVEDGDSTTAVAETLQNDGVVATVSAFLDASRGNTKIAAIQPGFYRVRTEIPAATAVKQLTDPDNRVGLVVVPEGSQLDDTTYMGTGRVTPGIFTLISKATCVDLNGDHHCVNAADLRKAAGTVQPAALAVPDWAVKQVTKMGNDHRRIEGLIAPGTWNVNPAASADQILATLIRSGTDHYEQSGLKTTATSMRISPYDVLVTASLVQRESEPDDFAKVARVIYNRLKSDYPILEFDSTVNYPLDRREVATTDADRDKKTPWNTYAMPGLPATPICSPDTAALKAAERPTPGDWLYFVTIDNEGTTLFTDDYQQHLANIEMAQENGVLDSSR